jgi:cytochrome c553
MKTILTAVIVLITVVSCSVNTVLQQAENGKVAGAELYQSKNCFRCHGMNAKITIEPNYPKLAGQNTKYLLQQMQDIKSGARANGETAAMKPIISTVNEKEMKAIAKWLSSLTTTVTMPNHANMSTDGAELYQEECSDCHDDDAPKMAGQNADYLFQQMKDFKNGKRANGRAKTMKRSLRHVDENEMKAIAEWLATLK